VGDEGHKAERKEENILLRLYYKPVVLFAVCFLNEFYVFKYYMGFFSKYFFPMRWNLIYPALVSASCFGAAYKTLVNFIMLWESSMRIIGLDVEQKNNPAKKESEEVKEYEKTKKME